MWTDIENTEPQIAQEDIICWMILRLEQEPRRKYTIPGQEDETINPGRMHHASCPMEIREDRDGAMYIADGAFHAFATYGDALQYTPNMRGHTPIHKCIIPKGTPYWPGSHTAYCNNGKYELSRCYASRTMLITNE